MTRRSESDAQSVTIKGDDHLEDVQILLGRVPAKDGGVLHVGAHLGEEVAAYLEAGFSPVVLIEANPGLHAELLSRFAGEERVKVFSCAIAAENGVADLRLHTSRSGSVEPASILPLGRFKEIVKTLQTPATIRVPCYSLDSFLDRNGFLPQQFSLLNVDVQGAELLVLAGARHTLESIDAVIAEVSLVELYEGGALEGAVVEFLGALGFSRVESVYHTLHDDASTFLAWGECLFLRGSPA